MKIRLKWERRDLWVGIYWTTDIDTAHVYICLVPCLPIHISWERIEPLWTCGARGCYHNYSEHNPDTKKCLKCRCSGFYGASM